MNASYQFDDNNSLGASISFLRNPKLQTDGKTEGSVLRDEVLTETNTSIRSEFGQNSNWSSNIYYVGKVGKLGIDFNTDWFWSKGNNKNNIDEHYQEVKEVSNLVSRLTEVGIDGFNNQLKPTFEAGHQVWYFRGYKYAGVAEDGLWGAGIELVALDGDGAASRTEFRT